LPDFYNSFQQVAKILKDSFSFFFKLSYLAYSQIWLNFVVGDHQFGYIREMKPKEEENKTKQNNLISIHEAK
jgi:hypothetical protein